MKSKRKVLVGGCFDVLHPGHIVFLEKAKSKGDFLIVLLESDRKVKILKGKNRPVQTQEERSEVLSAIKFVDQVIMLPFMKEEEEYDKLIKKIKPDVIAATRGDENVAHHKRAAKLSGAKFIYVTNMIGNHSSSRILNK